MPTRRARLKRELKELRATCIEQNSDIVLKRVAYEMECAVRYAIEPGIRGWPSLTRLAREAAQILKNELKAQS